MSQDDLLNDLLSCYAESPEPSFKVSNYFKIYAELFGHLRGAHCTFIEVGILNGGSLFMWRKWLGDSARIIGIDLNPEAEKWAKYGFEIYIGDQGSPQFWRDTFRKIGEFDVILDDGGHQSFQQIVTLVEGIKAAKKKCTIVIEDTCTSFFQEFSSPGENTFLEYAKDSTDILASRSNNFFAKQFPEIKNLNIVNLFSSVHSINFYSGIVAYRLDPSDVVTPELVWNKPPGSLIASDFRYDGVSSAHIDWPDLFSEKTVLIKGGSHS